ncbi:MAG TPA: ATP-binding protein [Anaeromyxobacteraceae bacterium]|nr:ATP-binding protein [Anaeromyxobacteraceae bacterium]
MVPSAPPEAPPRREQPTDGRLRGSSLYIAALFVVSGLAWVGLSGLAIDRYVTDPALQSRLRTFEDVVYVAISGVILYVLISRSEERLRRFGDELHATLDSLGDGVLVVGADGRILDVNRAVTELTGIQRRQEHLVAIQEWTQRVNLRQRDGSPVAPEQFATLRALRGERPGAYEAMIRRTDGSDLPVSITAATIYDRAGRPRLAVAVVRDTSEALRLSQTREELLATAAHELKTPLSVIKAHAQLLLRRAEPEPGLQVIVRQVDRLTRLVQQILDASRLRLDNVELRWERLDLAETAAVVVTDLGPRPGGHPVTFEGRGGAWVRADRDRITRVITALVDNALRFSPADSPVEVRVGVRGRETIFSVLDHGVGIPPERQDRVFERFYRAHSGVPDDRGGLGVGLDTCREIVARHGGRMWFQSEPGTGSTFLFALPLAGEEARA